MIILIVDDDQNTVNVIKSEIDWKNLDIGEVHTAYNVNSAKEAIELFSPDIVLCDIEMPQGSGIDLLKWIRKEKKKIEFIFLTCHENFDFASEAIEYGALGYVLKPFNIEKTIAVITKAQKKLLAERKLQDASLYGKYWLDLRSDLINKFWEELTRNENLTMTDICENVKVSGVNIDSDKAIRLIMISASKSQINEDIRNCFDFAISNMSGEIFQGNPADANHFACDTDLQYCIIQIVTQEMDENELGKQCSHLIELVQQYFNSVLNCYISEKRNLQHAWEGRKWLNKKNDEILLAKGQVLFQGAENQASVENKIGFPRKKYEELLENGRQLTIVNSMKAEVEKRISEGHNERNQIGALMQDYLQVIHTVLGRYEIDAHELFADPVLEQLSKSATVSEFDMIRWIDNVTRRTIGVLEQRRMNRGVIENAKKYIQKHYDEDISRNTVAEYVHLSPDYFAKSFHSETGELFNDYLNKYRISKAKDLLRDKSIGIGEISIRTGYGSVSYFSTVFRKYEGISPGDFRKNLIV